MTAVTAHAAIKRCGKSHGKEHLYENLSTGLFSKGQNPLDQFPRIKSVTSWQLPRLRGSYVEMCLMDFGHKAAFIY